MRLPRHIGIIPDGNRRWAVREGMDKADGYDHGIAPGMELFRMCRELGVEEMTFYGFTVDNTKRPSAQRRAFTAACIAAVEELSKEDASLLVLGNTKSSVFPREFLPYTTRRSFGKGGMKKCPGSTRLYAGAAGGCCQAFSLCSPCIRISM